MGNAWLPILYVGPRVALWLFRVDIKFCVSFSLFSIDVDHLWLRCFQKSRVVGLPGSVLIQLASSDLPKEAGITFSFRTQQEDALILLAIGSTPDVSLKKIMSTDIHWYSYIYIYIYIYIKYVIWCLDNRPKNWQRWCDGFRTIIPLPLPRDESASGSMVVLGSRMLRQSIVTTTALPTALRYTKTIDCTNISEILLL